MTRISVIMGIYNCARTLPEALDSLYNQTCQDFKIILCDDGSTDGTYAVAKQYADKHDNIVLINNERNMGLNHTLNRCLKYADTEYCARMDGDDISLPTRFEEELSFLDAHPEFSIVGCPMIYFDENGEFSRGKGGFEPSLDIFMYSPPFCHATCMIRREAYEAVGGYIEDAKYLRVEDIHLWIKMMEKGIRGYNLEKHLYAMRDDRNAAKRRTFRSSLCSTRVLLLACKTFHYPLKGYLLAFFPIIKYMLPTPIYSFLHKRKLSKINNH